MSTNSNQISANNTVSYIGANTNKDFAGAGYYIAGNTYYFQSKSNTIGTFATPLMGLPNFCCATLIVTSNGTDGVGQYNSVSDIRLIVNAAGVISLVTNAVIAVQVPLAGWVVNFIQNNATATSPATVGFSLTTTTVGALGVSGTLSFTQFP